MNNCVEILLVYTVQYDSTVQYFSSTSVQLSYNVAPRGTVSSLVFPTHQKCVDDDGIWSVINSGPGSNAQCPDLCSPIFIRSTVSTASLMLRFN